MQYNLRGSDATTPSDMPHAPAASDEWRLEPGSILQDTYRIDCLIATGGMGDVYRATHERLGGTFAIKILHKELLRENGLLTRFRTEAKIMASLHHPNIVQVFDFNVMPDGTPYLAMELAEGQDLRNVIAERGVLSPFRVAQIVNQTASALGAAHAHGVIHRDLKPENVMIVPMDGQAFCVKVVDFGVSKTRGQPRITVEPSLVGTPEFMSPEQAQGRNDEVDHRTDQFALGALAYTLLSGREPFHGATPVAVLYQVVHQEAVCLRYLVEWPCARIDAVLQRAMAKDRHDRYPTIMEMARAFEAAVAADLAAGTDGQRATPLPAKARPGTPPPPPRRGPDGRQRGALSRQPRDRPSDVPPERPSRRARTVRRVAVMMLSAACLAAATVFMVGGADAARLAPSNERVMGIYATFSAGASHLISRVRMLANGPLPIAHPAPDELR